MPPISLPRDTLDLWHKDAAAQQADLTQQDLDANPAPDASIPPEVTPPPPLPTPPTPPQAPPAPMPGPFDLNDLLGRAGLSAPVQAAAQGLQQGTQAVQQGVQQATQGVADQATSTWNDLTQRAGLAPSAPPSAPQTLTAQTAALPPVMPSDQLTNPLQNPTPPVQPGAQVSQFGDPQLTSDEAYAACGPAAAVNFAMREGRNPTLREATNLAAGVGWTSDTGMAGLSSEKALMDKLQVPTRLVPGDNWSAFANEAQTGNPVTISTRGHYFFADGYDPTSGAFHVGKSGTALKSGAEWMTPAQMTALMGPVQGALFADNPQTPAPSTASGPAGAAAAATQTTAGLSGGGDLSGQIGQRGQQIMSQGAQAASWLGEQGQKALQSVLVTEGGLNNARGDNGKSAGPLQFYEGGQLANLASQLGMTLDAAKDWVEQHPSDAVRWAIGTADKPGYLGAVIQKGIQLGKSGAELATYAQQYGQVSVSPERAGSNYSSLFGGGQPVVSSGTTTDTTTPTTTTTTTEATPPKPWVDPRLAMDEQTTRRLQDLRNEQGSYGAAQTSTTSDQGINRLPYTPAPVETPAVTTPAVDSGQSRVQQLGTQLGSAFTDLFQHLLGGGPARLPYATHILPIVALPDPLVMRRHP